MKIKEYINYLISKGEDYGDQYDQEDIEYIKEKIKEMEYDEKEDCFYFTLNKENMFKSKEVDILCHLNLCTLDSFYLMTNTPSSLYIPHSSLLNKDNKLRKVLYHDYNGDNSKLTSKCTCEKGFHNFEAKIKLTLSKHKRSDLVFLMLNDPQREENVYNFSTEAVKYRCSNCGKEYDRDDMSVLSKNGILSATLPSKVFYDEGKIVISTFKHEYESVKERVVYRQFNSRVVFNLNTGRQYVLPLRNKYTNKDKGTLKSFNSCTLSDHYYYMKIISDLTEEDYFKIGYTIQKHVKYAIPFDTYNEKAQQYLANRLESNILSLKILAAYNSNPYVHFEFYDKILRLKENIKITREQIQSNIYSAVDCISAIKPYNYKTVRNRNLLKEHDKYVKSLKISEEYKDFVRKDHEENNRFTVIDIDDNYSYTTLSTLANKSKIYDKIKDNKDVMDKINLLPDVNEDVFIALMNHNIFDSISSKRLYDKYVKQIANKLIIAQLEGTSRNDINRELTQISYAYEDIKLYNNKFKLKKLYDIDELRNILIEERKRYESATYKLIYTDKVKDIFNSKNVEILDTVNIELIKKSIKHYDDSYLTSTLADLVRGRALLVKYTHPKTKYTEYTLIDRYHTIGCSKYAGKKMSKLFEQNKNKIKIGLKVQMEG